ncbi:MAG: SusC/RagA family TonB-linked outer membrane protein, partial [Proteiniphilum sp.]|nr:SusC/RagA family TonB-linked outer membrane protein [Proteiniphilum sp.]
SSIGYKTLEVAVRNRTMLNLEMNEDTELLEEVVVVGYGTMRKSDISGASVTVGEDAIKGSVIANLDQAFQGRAAGVTSVMTSGAPGSSVSIRVRGQSTINANAEPLYVIDGVIVQSGGRSGHDFGLGDALGNSPVSTISPLSTINPSDILSMEILKDASATAIYGAQGANGVVLITTKHGKAGEAKFTYEGMYGVQRQAARVDMMNLREFAGYSNQVALSYNRPEFADPSLLGVGTNWQDAVFRRAPMHQHQLSAQGGTDAVRYFVSGSFMGQDGTIIGTEFNRYSFRVNLDSQLKNYLTYSGKRKLHDYTVMLGQEMWESDYEYQSVTASSLPSNDIKNPSLGTDPLITSGFGSSAMASFFGRASYNYDNRYMGTYTYRRDGSSNFGPKNRWAGFHSFAASWRFTKEAFFKPLSEVVNNGKLRIGWGQTGNANIGGYRWGAAIARMPSGLGLGYRQSNIANPYIKWETQEQLNLGLDLNFFNNRIGLVVDAYDKTSKDMLMPLQLPSYMGTRGNVSSALAAPFGNYGTINNKGIECTLNTRNLTGAFSWHTEFQISFNQNKLVALDGTDAVHIEGYGQWSDVVSISNVGESLYNFYGYKVVGVYQDLEDLQNSPKPEKYPTDGVFNRYNTTWAGDLKFADLSGPEGKPDGVIDSYDRTNIGSPLPKLTFGMTNSFSYKNFDMSVFFSGTYGNKVYNYTSINLSSMKSAWDNQLRVVTDRANLTAIDPGKSYPATVNGVTVYEWKEDITNVRVTNPDTRIPRAIANDPNDNDRISDRYIEDGSYLRIRNITLGYTLPASVSSKWMIENIRVYANIQNLYTFTHYTGYDPEIGASTASQNVFGLDNGRYPSPQVYSFGVSLSF